MKRVFVYLAVDAALRRVGSRLGAGRSDSPGEGSQRVRADQGADARAAGGAVAQPQGRAQPAAEAGGGVAADHLPDQLGRAHAAGDGNRSMSSAARSRPTSSSSCASRSRVMRTRAAGTISISDCPRRERNRCGYTSCRPTASASRACGPWARVIGNCSTPAIRSRPRTGASRSRRSCSSADPLTRGDLLDREHGGAVAVGASARVRTDRRSGEERRRACVREAQPLGDLERKLRERLERLQPRRGEVPRPIGNDRHEVIGARRPRRR